jgi:hypothetical protein
MHADSGKRRAVRIASIVTAFAVAAGLALLAWIGGELHYRNCLASVELRYPGAYQMDGKEPGQYGDWRTVPPHFVFYREADRNNAIASCSRWP